jgi:hypothetical protein
MSFAAHGQAAASASKAQLAFLSQDSFPVSAPLPQQVLKILLRQQLVRDSMERASDEDKKNPAQLFRAAQVHLFNPNEMDLFVVGNVPIAGADNGWFWVILSAHKNPRIVLFTTGYAVELLSTKTNRYHDIQSTWSNPNGTETRIYRFNGTRYKLTKDRWEGRR